MTIEIGSKVRELPEAAVKTTLDPMFKFFFELAPTAPTFQVTVRLPGS